MEQRIKRLESSDHSPEEDAEHASLRRIMTVLDFAGQRMYYIMHHILMSPRLSVYIVCMNLASNPDAQTDGDEGSSVPMTVLENVHFWLNSIAAQAPQAPIILVGTHADAVTGKSSSPTVLTYSSESSPHPHLHLVLSQSNRGWHSRSGWRLAAWMVRLSGSSRVVRRASSTASAL